MKPIVQETRFDFRKGRNTSISPDLLNDDELVDTTNARLSEKYGAFTKRSGCQRMHPDTLPDAVRGVTQWDSPVGKQVVAISNGDLYFRNGFDFGVPFQKATIAGIARSTAAQGAGAGWTDGGGSQSGPVGTDTTVTEQALCKLGDPAVDNNTDAANDIYTIRFTNTASGVGMSGTYAAIDSIVSAEYSVSSGAPWVALGTVDSISASIGVSNSHNVVVAVSIPAGGPPLWIRLNHRFRVVGLASGNGSGTLSAGGQPVTWTTGASRFSTSQPSIFAPFRASASGAPLVLYIASGGHYFSWDGIATVTQLDPTNSAPLTTSIISYHTRMFAMSASTETPGLLPKTIFWSKIGDATNFNTGDKTFGGAAVTDFLTGQQLTGLEVIGSSLLMATIDSIMRFQGHASDDIVISQDTEGVSAEVGVVGPLALKRYENVVGFMAARGPYAATEVSAVPIGEQVLPDFDALDSANIGKTVVQYNRGRKELLFVVPGANDSGLNKTIFAQAVRLQAWYGPWTYSFGIHCMSNYIGASGIENVIAGCSDGYVRLMDVGRKDDVLYDGSGGSNITMTVEFPTMQHGLPGITKALNGLKLQATIPAGAALQFKHSYDGAAFVTEDIDSEGSTELNYRVDLDNQGKRLRSQFVDASDQQPIVNGFILEAYDYARP